MGLELKAMDRRAAGMLLSGVVLLLAAVAGLAFIPRGPSEFGYAPFSPEPLPFAPMRGFTFEQAIEHLLRVLLATPGLLLLSLGLARVMKGDPGVSPALHRRLALAASACAVLFIAWVMLFVLEARPITDDELTYRDQAAMLLEGQLGRPAPALHFAEQFTIASKAGYTGKYLPGEPLLQLPGVLAGVPGLMHLPLAALTLALCFFSLRRTAGATVASWTVVLLAASPMFLFASATGQSMASSLFCVALAGFGHVQATHGRPLRGALILGAAVSLGMMVRPQSMAPVGAVLVTAALVQLLRRGRPAAAALLLATLAGGAAAILIYSEALTGSPFILPWFMLEPVERYGFGQVWDFSAYRHTPWTALQNLGVLAVRFNAWWLGWPSGLLLLWLWWRNGRPLDGALVWILAGAAILLFQSLYYSTGVSDTGVTYHYELLLPAAVLGANAIRQGWRAAPRFTAALLVVHFAAGTAGFLWFHAGRLGRLADAIHQDADAALARVQRPALLLYDVHCSRCVRVGWVLSCFPR